MHSLPRFSLLGIVVGSALLITACHSGTTAIRSDSGASGVAGSTGGGGSSGAAGNTGGGGTTGGGGVTGTAGSTGGGGTTYDGPLLGVDGSNPNIGSTACSDGKDNDGDGLVDYDDPECVGPLDNDEGTFATGIPGDNIDACKQDCFFDGNSGMGDDGCDWQLKCDPLNSGATSENKCPYSAAYAQQHAAECSVSMSQSQKCIDHCRPLVPNGCDCFGCCLIPGAPNGIRLAATCTAKDFNDPTKCPPCTFVTQCGNPCDKCELCVGKDTLPADCGGTGGAAGTGGTAGSGGAGGTGGAPPAPTPDCGTLTACVRNPQGTIDPVSACPANYGCIQGCCFPLNVVQ